MKNLSFALVLFVFVLSVYSCSKDSSSSIIAGKWNIVSDSTYNSGIGPNGPASGGKYIGVSGDYFNFTAGGKLYVKEGSNLIDTADYTLNGNKLDLKYNYLMVDGATITGASGNYTVSRMFNKLVLTNDLISPGGHYYESIVLSK